jgi:hypothetical protein
MSSRLMQALLVLVLSFTLLGVAGSAQACCGEAPDWFFDLSVVGQPDCSYRGNTGRVEWSAQYRLPTNNTFVYSYGDGVIQGSDFYDNLPHTPGYDIDTYSSYTIWTWNTFHPINQSYKVRVEFWISLPAISQVMRALIVFDCTPRGVQNLTIYDGVLYPDP